MSPRISPRPESPHAQRVSPSPAATRQKDIALIDLLDRSQFGEHEYILYQVYLKALYEYLKD